MSRRLVIPLFVVSLIVAALVAVAAVGTPSLPVVQVAPQVHREGNIVTDLMDASKNKGAAKVVTNQGSMEMSVYRSAFKQLEEVSNLGWQEDLRHACHRNLPLAAILFKSLGLPQDQLGSTVADLRGFQPYCPSGGQYRIDEKTGAVACSLHGNSWKAKQPSSLDKSSKTLERVNARLAFTPEGLMTTVDIKRSGKK